MSIKIQKASEVVGDVIDIKKIASTKDGARKPPRAETRLDVEKAVNAMILRGDVVPRKEGAPPRTTDDPELRESFGRLIYVGADTQTICRTLGIARNTYYALKRQHLEANIECLIETGAVGMVAMSFDKLDYASRRALQLVASLSEERSNAYALMHAIRLVKEIESEKIQLLVKTGAISVKKKVEISGSLTTETASPVLPGEKGQRIMVDIISKLTEAEDAEVIDGEVQ